MTSTSPLRGDAGSFQVWQTSHAVLVQNWWAFAARGVLGILFGLIALVIPFATMLSLVLLFSAYVIVDGVFAIMSAVRNAREHNRWGLLALEGIVDIVAGVLAFFWPGIALFTFVMFVAAWAIVTGVLMTTAAFRLNVDHGRWWLVLGGVASIIYGILLVVAPVIGALVLTWWIGAYALVFGAALLVLAFRLRAQQHGDPARTAAARAA